MSDFNFPIVTFTSDYYSLHIDSVTSESSAEIFDFFSENCFLQLNQIKNHISSQLDLVFSNSINTFESFSFEELKMLYPILFTDCGYNISSDYTFT